MKTTKRYISCLIISLIIAVFGTTPVFAQNHVRSIDVEAVLYEDGSMYITQVWEGSFDEGTEVYIPLAAPDYLKISDLRVADHKKVYQVVEPWDIEASFEDKAYKCGLNYTDEGYEICFGLSEYGSNRYAIEYRLENAIGSYTDLDGVNFRFVNSGMNTTPTDVKVEIRLADGTPLNDEVSDIWAFGYEGQVVFEDGAIRAFTEKPITGDNHVTVMVSFNKGLLNPSRTESVSFAEIKEEAFKASDYDYESQGEEVSALEAFLTVVVSIGFPLALILLISKLKKRSAAKKMQELAQRVGYFREVPNKGNIQATYALGRLFELCEDGAILGTGMLRLIQLGCLAPVRLEEVGFLGKTKEVVSLELKGSNHKEMNEYDEYLYTVLEGAAGSDGIFQPKELPKFADKNDILLRNYIDQSNAGGLKYLKERQCLKRWDIPAKLKHLNPSGEEELGELVGFKQYLEDFSLVAERGVQEMPIWQELLSYALLFGIADKVAEQMREVYPQLGAEVEQYSQNIRTSNAYGYLLVANMRQAEERRAQAARSKGSGGFSPLGGGGGSIGGGHGGEQDKPTIIIGGINMGLFSSKKNPCAICGGATPRIFATMIENQPLCSDCSGRIDMEPSLQDNMTLQSIKEHFVFLDENQALRNGFVISQKIDFGFFGKKMIFDMENELFCMSGEPDKMIFSGSHLKSFTIKEDHELLFEGSSEGLRRHTSSVPDRVAALAPQLAMIRMTEQVANRLDRQADNKNNYRPRTDVPEPFEEFKIMLKLEHPYWQTIEFKVSGPDFSNTHPDANSYLREYDQTAAKLEELATSLMYIAFPEAGEVLVNAANPSQPAMAGTTPVDSIEEIRRFKGLLEEGLITEAEFAAKKKQLLGI